MLTLAVDLQKGQQKCRFTLKTDWMSQDFNYPSSAQSQIREKALKIFYIWRNLSSDVSVMLEENGYHVNMAYGGGGATNQPP